MTAAEVKLALRSRHPACSRSSGQVPMFDAWTVIEEWDGIDLLAFSAHRHPARGAQRKADYPRVGYEVKVSRSDLRKELLAPGKRMAARALCHELYLAVPAGLLNADELAFVEPDWAPGDFHRPRCERACSPASHWTHDYRERGWRKNLHVVRGEQDEMGVCEGCAGRGYAQRSRVERDAPTLWIPRDVGLVEVRSSGCRVVRKSPVLAAADLSARQLGDLVRWVSARPDPRHDGLVAQQRAFMAGLRR